MDEVELTVLRWNDFIKRKDCTQKKWWAFDVDTLLHPDFLDIPGDYFKVYCWVISIANKFGSSEIRLHKKHASKILNVSIEEINNAILYLSGKRWKTRTCTETYESVRKRTKTSPRIDKNRIEENRIDNAQNENAVRKLTELDFEIVYSFYPRKEGKSAGFKKIRSQLKTHQDLDDLRKAIDNYSTFLKRNGTEARFIKHFSTFMNEWRDWLDPATGTASEMKPEIDWEKVFNKSEAEA